VAVLAQVLEGQLAPDLVQGMRGMGHCDETQPHERIAGKPGGMREQMARSTRRCISASSVPLSTVSYSSMCVCGRSSPNRAKHCSNSHVGKTISTARRSSGSQPAASCRPHLQGAASSSNDLARRYRTSPSASGVPCGRHFEGLDAEQGFDLLHRISDRRLALVKDRCGLGIAAGVDHGQKGPPLLQ